MPQGRDNSNGRFTKGNNYGRGRPPRNYSISHALSALGDDAYTTDHEGNVRTNAWAISRFLIDVAVYGEDRRPDPDDPDNTKVVPVTTKERMDAANSIIKAIEPARKEKARDVGDEPDPEAAVMMANLDSLTDEELKVLSKALAKDLS